MRICFTSDLHGSALLYDQLGELVREQQPDLLILGGDMQPDGMEPDPPASQRAFVQGRFREYLAGWRVAAPRLAVAGIGGNHDWRSTCAALGELPADEYVLLPGDRTWAHRGTAFTGYWHTPPTPFWLKDHERLDLNGSVAPAGTGRVLDPEMDRVIEVDLPAYFAAQPRIADDVAALATPAEPWIFVCHAPPYGTQLDRLPGIAEPTGSQAVRQFIEQRRPTVALHGHIHESPGLTGRYAEEVGQTLCINPGQGAEQLHAVIFETDDPRATLRHTVYR